MVRTPRIELDSPAFQTGAMTTLAQSAKLGGDGGSRTPNCRLQAGRVPASTTPPLEGKVGIEPTKT